MKRTILVIALVAGICLAGCKGRAAQQNNGDESAVNTEQTETKADENTVALPEQDLIHPNLTNNFIVAGPPCVEAFMEALPIYNDEYGWGDGEPEIDNKNGYFSYSYEGDGGESYHGAVWKRNDGKRLFIFSYSVTVTDLVEGRPATTTRQSGNAWYYASTEVEIPEIGEDEEAYFWTRDRESGFYAYLYNEDTKTLEKLSEPPFNGWKAKKAHRVFILPQIGKDIEVIENTTSDDYTSSMLKWNGMTFDYE